MDELKWPRALNEVLTRNWHTVKNTLVMKDFVDHLIQQQVVTVDYWIGLKSKPVTESERTEDFLSLVMKFNREKYAHFLEALLACGQNDLVKVLAITDEGHNRKMKGHCKTIYSAEDTDGRNKKKKSMFREGRKQEHSKVHDQNQAKVSSDEPNRGFDRSRNHDNNATERQGLASSVGKQIQQTEGSPTARSTNDVKNSSARTKSDKNINASKQMTDGRKSTNDAREETTSPNHTVIQVKEWSPADQEPDVHPEKERTQSTETGSRLQSQRSLMSAKSREEILDMREEILRNKETELKQKEKELKQQEQDLEIKQINLQTRENTLLGIQSDSGESAGFVSTTDTEQLMKVLQGMANGGESPTVSTTQTTEVYGDVIKATKARQAIEFESNPKAYTPSKDQQYVRLKDLHSIQTDIEGMKEEIATDRDSREVLQQKMETQMGDVQRLTGRISILEEEKSIIERQMRVEIDRMTTEMKNSNLKHTDGIKRIKHEIDQKESECIRLRSEITDLKKRTDSLHDRVTALEKDKMIANREIQRYEKEVQHLQSLLKKKEAELLELRKLLEETESEKEDLMDEVAELKAEVIKLKTERKRLEQEKRTLLNRCVVPNWNQNTRRTSSLK